jgi:23S rRNA (guanine745-N1)-methyltransferase
LTLHRLAGGLRCPFCFSAGSGSVPLSPAGPLILGCENGHRHDVNKRGYVSLLPPRTRVVGDSADMLVSRARFFDTGAYQPIADAVARACTDAVVQPGARIAEIGCGTGYYLRAASTAMRAEDVLAADLSPAAVRTAVNGVPGAVGVVLDVWQPLPLADASRDVLLSVFAPRNLPEFARVLDTDGCVVAVVPTGNHLREARTAGLALDVPEGKAGDLVGAAAPWFDEAARTEVEFTMTLDSEALDLLLGMGPSAHHALSGGGSSVPNSQVTASVTVLTLRRRS